MSYILNPEARSHLKPNVVRPYVLNEVGSDQVFNSNEGLDDNYFDHLEFPISRFWFKYFADKIAVLPPEKYGRALDICCGTGTVCLNIMSEHLFEECQAIDIAQPAIAVLNKRIAQEKIANLSAFCSNIMKTKFDDDSFDCIIGNSFLHHLPDNESFLKETFRILKDGGTICFTSEPTRTGAFLEDFFVGNLMRVLRFFRLKAKLVKTQPNLSDIWLYEKDSLTLMLNEVGFQTVKIKGFGFLTALFNGPFTIIFQKISGKSMQPDWWWKLFTSVDKYLFFWLPENSYSHFTICARKPEKISSLPSEPDKH